MNTEFKKNQEPEGYKSANPLPSSEEFNDFYARLYYQKPQTTSYEEKYDADDTK